MPELSTHRNASVVGEVVTVGGLPISALTREHAARLMLDFADQKSKRERPFYLTSANGEVIARAAAEEGLRELFLAADQILADGQPLVLASRWLCRHPIPERVATTDLFHDVACLAETTGHSFYLLGASPDENERAVAQVRARYPRLKIAGHCHGFLRGEDLHHKLDEINAIAPDILWLGMGVPREQQFVCDYAPRLSSVGVIKTSGGLFNFLSGTNPRAPAWMQQIALEWAFRLVREPRRLFWRYLSTNPKAAYLILTRSS